MKSKSCLSILLKTLLLIGLVIPFAIFAQTNDPANSGGGAAPPDLGGLSSFIVGLTSKIPWLTTIVIIMGALRLVLKPVMLAAEWFTKSTPNPDDDVAVLKFEAGPVYKWLAIALDFIGSVKLPVIAPPPQAASSSGARAVLIAAALTLGLTRTSLTSGCALFGKDIAAAQKAANLQSLVHSAALIGTQEAIALDPGNRAQFQNAKTQLDALIAKGAFDGTLLRQILANLPVKELKSTQARIAIEGATTVYDLVVGNAVNVEKNQYIAAAINGIRDGIAEALGP